MDISATNTAAQSSFKLDAAEKLANDRFVEGFNKSLNEGKGLKNDLEMNDFLKILTTQLSHQDPAAPMEDKEFVAQMAQISSLKQMSGMAADIAKLTSIFGGAEATSALGKQVEITEGDRTVQGAVKAVTRGGDPTVLVNGEYFNWKLVNKVFEE